ncbi:unnamed protein product, partial [Didymodactylos carnosus]
DETVLSVAWLNSGLSTKEVKNRLQQELELPIQFFNDDNVCSDYIYSHHNRDIFLIVSGDNLRNFISVVYTLSQLRSIYICCSDDNLQFLKSWSESCNKVQGVFSTEDRLLFKLAIDISLYWTEKGDNHYQTGNTQLADNNYQSSQNLYVKMIKYLNT